MNYSAVIRPWHLSHSSHVMTPHSGRAHREASPTFSLNARPHPIKTDDFRIVSSGSPYLLVIKSVGSIQVFYHQLLFKQRLLHLFLFSPTSVSQICPPFFSVTKKHPLSRFVTSQDVFLYPLKEVPMVLTVAGSLRICIDHFDKCTWCTP